MIRAAVIFLALALAVHATAAEVDVPRLAEALRVREGWSGHDGAAGERGPWQITRAVWAQEMPGRSFAEARQWAPARACALKHIARLVRGLQARGVDASVFNIALAWNAGVAGATHGRAPVSAYLFAGDVENLYFTTETRRALISQLSALSSQLSLHP